MANWTGNAYVDSLLLGEKWDTNNLTYFLGGGTAVWNSVETAAIQAALQSWADVANLTFTQVFLQASADLVENQNVDIAGNLGVHTVHNNYTTSTLQPNGTQLTGTYNTNGYGWDETSATGGLQVGGLGYLTLVHELGHGLGLDHTHNDGGGNVNFFPGVTSNTSSGNNALNQDVYSAMSYVHGLVGKGINGGANADNYGFVAGPMAFDIATIQYMYGANTTQNSGNNTYILPDANAGGTYFSALWDTGGIDEIVYQGATDTVIDLRSATLTDQVGGGGFLSQTSGITGGFTIAGDFTNALVDVNGETGVIIENASGGSGSDTLTGNNVANVLSGNAGNDMITAAGGNDTLNGGFGADTLNGDAGADTLVGGADGDTINGGSGADIIYGDNLDGSGRTGTSAITLGTGTINKAGGNVSIATAQDISTQFSLGTNAEIVSSTSIPHVSVSGTGNGNVDYYKITLNNSNVTLTLDIDHANEGAAPAAFDSEISIYAANGALIANNDDAAIDAGSLSGLDSGLSHTFVDAGTYYIAVGSYSNLSTDPAIIAAGGTYVLQVSVSGELINNNDTIFGGADNDIIHASVGNDVIDGGTGIDTYNFSHDTQGATVDLAAATNQATGAGIGTDQITGIESIVGGSGADSITGDNNINVISGGAGNDTINGGLGSDTLYGGAGNDRITYDASDNLANVLGGADTDTLVVLGGSAPLGFDLVAHEFEIAEHSFGIAGGATERDNYNSSWQRTDRTVYETDGSRSVSHFDPAGLVNTIQVDDNYNSSGGYASQTGFYDAGGRWAAQFNLPGNNDYVYNYFDASDQLDYTTGRFDNGLTFLEDTDQGNLNAWTSKYAVNTASGAADYQYDYYDDGTRSYLDHDQNGVENYLYQYTFYDANDVATHYFGKNDDGTDFYFVL